MRDNDVKQVLAMKYIIRRFVALVVVAIAVAVPAILGTWSFIRDKDDNHNPVGSASNPLLYSQVEPHISAYLDGLPPQAGGTGDSGTATGGGIYANADIAVGTVLLYAGDEAPDGFLLCDGKAVSRKKYAKLYAAIGDKYGNGDGSSTFNLPNMRTLLPVGLGDEFLSAKGGAAMEAEIAFKKISVPSDSAPESGSGTSSKDHSSAGSSSGSSADSNTKNKETKSNSNSQGKSPSTTAVMNFIIKY
jgi:microcystin-dependent protein